MLWGTQHVWHSLQGSCSELRALQCSKRDFVWFFVTTIPSPAARSGQAGRRGARGDPGVHHGDDTPGFYGHRVAPPRLPPRAAAAASGGRGRGRCGGAAATGAAAAAAAAGGGGGASSGGSEGRIVAAARRCTGALAGVHSDGEGLCGCGLVFSPAGRGGPLPTCPEGGKGIAS